MDLNSNLSDILNLLSSIKSDKERQELAEKIRYEHKKLLEDEVQSRRMKSRELIMELSRIDRAIEEFEFHYEILKEKSNITNIEALDEYLLDMKKYRKKLAIEKRGIKW